MPDMEEVLNRFGIDTDRLYGDSEGTEGDNLVTSTVENSPKPRRSERLRKKKCEEL